MLTPLEDIKSKTDIVQHIGQYVKLTPSGKSLRGLCPFHKEKTPSFFVSPERQVWYCFGCQKGGDIFKFVMEYEKLDFPEALKLLADKAGIVLTREDPRIQSMRTRTLEVLKYAQDFYARSLKQNPVIQKYVASRGLEQKTIETFGLGFAPHGWQNIFSFLKAKGFTPQEMEGAGLIIRRTTNDVRLTTENKQSGYYDRFRSRVMFPVYDHMDRVVGFSGRIVPTEFGGPDNQMQEAKYINTPDTLVYQKGRILYGFHKTKDAIKDLEHAVLVEGNMDMLMGWQGGIANIVAVSGTGLTEDQLRMLKRVCSDLVLNFDMDRAGEMATDRSIGLALKAGFRVKILTLPDGKDMADFVHNHPSAAHELASHAQESMEYYFDNAFGKLGADASLDEKKQAVTYLLPRVKLLSHPMDQHIWIEKLSHKVHIPDRVLEDELKHTQTALDIADSDEEDMTGVRVNALFVQSRLDALAERSLGLALKISRGMQDCLEAIEFFPHRFRDFVRMLAAIPFEAREQGMFPDGTDQESINYLILRAEYEIALLPEKTDIQNELRMTLSEMKRESVHARLRETTQALKEAEEAHNQERVQECMQEFHALTKILGGMEATDEEIYPRT